MTDLYACAFPAMRRVQEVLSIPLSARHIRALESAQTVCLARPGDVFLFSGGVVHHAITCSWPSLRSPHSHAYGSAQSRILLKLSHFPVLPAGARDFERLNGAERCGVRVARQSESCTHPPLPAYG